MQALVMGVLMLIAVAAALTLGLALVGAPVPLVDGRRKRREQAIERQIALTDALDARLGPIVAPVVTKPLWAPWEIRIAVPFLQPGAVAEIVAVVDEVFGGGGGIGSPAYRMVLRAQDPSAETREPTSRWTAHPLAAA